MYYYYEKVVVKAAKRSSWRILQDCSSSLFCPPPPKKKGRIFQVLVIDTVILQIELHDRCFWRAGEAYVHQRTAAHIHQEQQQHHAADKEKISWPVQLMNNLIMDNNSDEDEVSPAYNFWL